MSFHTLHAWHNKRGHRVLHEPGQSRYHLASRPSIRGLRTKISAWNGASSRPCVAVRRVLFSRLFRRVQVAELVRRNAPMCEARAVGETKTVNGIGGSQRLVRLTADSAC